MTWFMAGAAGLSAVTSIIGGNSQAKAAAKQASAQNTAMGEQVTKERLNTTIRNSYSTALAQMQLGLKKRQLASQGADIKTGALMVKGDVVSANAATGSIGASVQAVMSDIEQKSQAALDMTTDSFENAVENYNNDLNMMVLNTDMSRPGVQAAVYSGPSTGAIIGGSLLGAAGQFASGYATRKFTLGLGKP